VRVFLLAAVLCCACKETGTFKCTTSDQCRLGDEIGFCEESGYCTFLDPTCASHRRYDETAEYPIGGDCLTGWVTGHVYERFIVNDENGLPATIARSPAMLAVTAELDDGTKPAVRIDHDGAFAFPAPEGAHYELVVPVYGLLQTSAPHLEIASITPGRPDSVPTSKTTTIRFTYNATALGSLWIASTGAYTETLTTGSATNFNFDWYTASTANGQRAGLLDEAKGDVLYVNQTANIGGYISIVASAQERLTLVDGMGASATSTLSPTMRDQCVQLRTNAVAEVARLKVPAPTLANATSGWFLYAALARDATEKGALTLATHLDAMPMNASLNVTYSNPYPGTQMLGLQTVAATTSISAAGFNVTVPMASSAFDAFDPAAGCSATLAITSTTAIGGDLVVGGTMIDANNKDVTADVATRIPVAWSQSVSGIAHVWSLGIYEVSDDGAGGLVFQGIYGMATPDTHALLPKGLLQSGHTYIASLLAIQGPPNAARGDFVTYALPAGSTQSWSRSFKMR
jgi:hypothetical protein